MHIGGSWRLVDPTGLAPVETLVRVATGQDAGEVAFMTICGAAQCLAQAFEVSDVVDRAAWAPLYPPACAACRAAMSSLTMSIMAAAVRRRAAWSPLFNNSGSCRGVICQRRP